jgi:hypothetical protein
MHGDHLVSEPMRRVQHISCVGQQDEILDPLSLAACIIALGHVSESSNRRASERPRPGVQGVRMIAQQG